MAGGCVAVLSNAVDAGSIYQDGIDFISFPTGNSRELAEVLNRLLKDDAEFERIAKNGMQQAKNNTWRHVAEKYVKALSDIEKDRA